MQYMRVYSTGENYSPGAIYEVVRDNIRKLEIDFDCAFCLIRNAYFSMVLVVVDSPLPVDDSVKIANRLREFYSSLEFPGRTPTYGESAFFGEGVSVGNLKQRILSWPHEQFEIIQGPIVRRNRSQTFLGVSVEAAKATAQSAIPSDSNLILEVISDVQEKAIEGEGKSEDEAIETAKSQVPSHAFDIKVERITQEGFLGILGKHVKVQIAYKTQAAVQAKYYEVDSC
jgi:hypothetical protein